MARAIAARFDHGPGSPEGSLGSSGGGSGSLSKEGSRLVQGFQKASGQPCGVCRHCRLRARKPLEFRRRQEAAARRHQPPPPFCEYWDEVNSYTMMSSPPAANQSHGRLPHVPIRPEHYGDMERTWSNRFSEPEGSDARVAARMRLGATVLAAKRSSQAKAVDVGGGKWRTTARTAGAAPSLLSSASSCSSLSSVVEEQADNDNDGTSSSNNNTWRQRRRRQRRRQQTDTTQWRQATEDPIMQEIRGAQARLKQEAGRAKQRAGRHRGKRSDLMYSWVEAGDMPQLEARWEQAMAMTNEEEEEEEAKEEEQVVGDNGPTVDDDHLLSPEALLERHAKRQPTMRERPATAEEVAAEIDARDVAVEALRAVDTALKSLEGRNSYPTESEFRLRDHMHLVWFDRSDVHRAADEGEINGHKLRARTFSAMLSETTLSCTKTSPTTFKPPPCDGQG